MTHPKTRHTVTVSHLETKIANKTRKIQVGTFLA